MGVKGLPLASDDADWEAVTRLPRGIKSLRRFLRRVLAAEPDSFCRLPRVDASRSSRAAIDAALRSSRALILTGLLDGWLQRSNLTRGATGASPWGLEHFVMAHGLEVHEIKHGVSAEGAASRIQPLGAYLASNASEWHIFEINEPFFAGSSPHSTTSVAHRSSLAKVRQRLAPLFSDFAARHVFSVGLQGSGSSRHHHEESWLALLHGLKGWWIGAEDRDFAPFAGWSNPCRHLQHEIPKHVYFCIQRPGEVMYLADGVNHATCNLERFVLGVGGQGHTHSWPQLVQAAQEDDFQAVMRAISSKADLSVTNTKGETALHRAATYGHTRIANFLLDSRALTSPQAGNGIQPLHLAVHHGHYAVTDILIKGGASVRATNMHAAEPLHIAAEQGHKAIATLLVGSGASPAAFTKDGSQPLHAAAQGHLTLVDLLLAMGAQVDATDVRGVQPVHWAARAGLPTVLQRLLASKAKVHARDVDGVQPLHLAAAHGHLVAAAFLMSQGALINASAHDGTLPLHWAAFAGENRMISELARWNANVLATTVAGVTAHQFAVMRGHGACVHLLDALISTSGSKGQ